MNQSLSASSRNLIGVPQGSTLSPVLFNLYVEPLMEILQQANISFHMYADHTQLYIKITSIEEIVTMNQALKRTVHWLTSNHLKLNPHKKEFLLISPQKSATNICEWTKLITTLNCPPRLVDSTKPLGIMLDKNLNMLTHINTMAKNAHFLISEN